MVAEVPAEVVAEVPAEVVAEVPAETVTFKERMQNFGQGVKSFGNWILAALRIIMFPFRFIFRIVEKAVYFILKPIAELLTDIPFENTSEFFAWFGGSDLEVWRKTPSPQQGKRTALGFLMFVIATVSALFAGKMWGDIFHSIPVGIVVFFLWFMLIWSMERSIIIYIDHGNGKKWIIITRLLIVLIVSFVNTTFLGIMIFDTEIQQVLVEYRSDALKHNRNLEDNATGLIQAKRDVLSNDVVNAENAYNKFISDQESKIDNQRQQLATNKARLMNEIAGSVGSGFKGYGTAAKADEAVVAADQALLDQMVTKLENLRTNCPQYTALQDAKEKLNREDPPLLAQLQSIRKNFAERADNVNVQKMDGYSDRYDALWGVARKTPVLIIGFFLLFLAIESMPILMKIMASKDNYEEILSTLRNEKSAEIAQESSFKMLQNLEQHEKNTTPLRETALQTKLQSDAIITELQGQLDNQRIAKVQNLNNFLAQLNTSTNLDDTTIKKIKEMAQGELLQTWN